MRNPESIKEILDHHFKGGKFEYQSFDFKNAAEEYSQTQEWKNHSESAGIWNTNIQLKDKYQIPEEIRDKHIIWRIGKLRSVDFSPKGTPYRIKMGAKYAVTFYDYESDLMKIKLIEQ